jgi:CheY-like chemotaxis protein
MPRGLRTVAIVLTEFLITEHMSVPMKEAAGHRRRVLIVDDVQDITSMLCELVMLLGHDAQVANDGHEALERTREFHPDLVLLDLGMPDVDGFEIARMLRAEPDGNAIELIAMSGWGHQSARARAVQAGFDRHFLKPITVAHLTALLGMPPKPRASRDSATLR